MKKPIKMHSFKAVKPRYSFKALGIGAALQVAWIGLPTDLTDAVPDTWKLGIVAVILLFGVLGSFIQQDIRDE